MKLTAILLLAAGLQVSARTSGQTVTLDLKNVPVQKVFKEVIQQTGVSILYDVALFENSKPVTIKVTDAPVSEVLNKCLEGLPLKYVIEGGSVVISKDPVAETQIPPPIDVKGRIVNEKGEGVIVTVMVKGTNNGTSSNADGYFELKGVEENATLLITATNVETLEIKVNGRNDLGALGIKMRVSPLDEVQVIAYGTQTKRYSVGNVTTVKGVDIAKQPVANPLLALQGRVPGLFIEQATGLPGTGVKVRIQGQNSLERGSDPLYVIDGVPYSAQFPFNSASQIQGHSGSFTAGNPLSYINPADIESIEVLKDANATSIYGSRASAGAVLITTKKGKAGKTSVNLNIQKGWSKVRRFVDLLNNQQYLEMRHEAMQNDGIIPGPTDYDLNGRWDTTRNIDWQKELIGGTAQYTDAQLTLSGGSATTTFLINGGFHRETTVFPGNKGAQRGSIHLNAGHRSTNQRFYINADLKYMVDNTKLIFSDLTNVAIKLPPVAPALYNPDGNLNWAPDTFGNSTWLNPLSYLEQPYNNQVNNLVSNLVIGYELSQGLEIKANAGYTYLTRRETGLYPLTSWAPEQRPFTPRASIFNNDVISTWIIEPQVNYKRYIGKGDLEVLVGTTFTRNQSDQQHIDASGFSSDLLMESLAAASQVTANNSAITYKYNALFGRLNYNWKGKYVVNLNGRRDGSSRFGSENLFQNFWSLGGAWIFSEEGFLKKSSPFLSFGKLRGSFGTSGNEQIGDYKFMSLYYANSPAVPYQGVPGLFTDEYSNPYLQWEETKKLQIGIDLGFFRDRIIINVGHYRNSSSNQLQPYALPEITGVSSITANFPATIRNYGWELSLSSINIQRKNFSWSSAINATLPNNKLVAYKNLEQSSYANQYIIGEPFTILKIFQFAGVDPTTGIYIFKKERGDLTSSPVYPDDATVIFNNTSKFYGGIQNSIGYKGFSLDFLFQIVQQKKQNYQYFTRAGGFYSDAFGSSGNQPVWVMERWRQPGDNSNVQRFYATFRYDAFIASLNASQSDAAYTDASYIRLKNVSFSWQLPQLVLQRLHLQNARIYTQGQNLFTFTKHKGFDPESRSMSSLPPLRVWTLGIQLTL